MSIVEENVYINKVPYNITLNLNKALDAQDKWRNLLAAIDEAELEGPPLEPDYVYVLENCFKRRQSPTETLLNELGQKGYKVAHLKHWLHCAGLKQALNLLEGGNPTTGSSYRRSASYSDTKITYPPVDYRVTTPTEGRAGFGGGGTIQSNSETRRRRTEECIHTSSMSHEFCPTQAPFSSLQFPPEIKHRHLVMFSSTVPPGSEEHTSGQSSTYSHTAQGTADQVASNISDHPHFGQIPSDIGLTHVVSKIGAEYEKLAVLLGIPRAHAIEQSGSLKGLDTLVYWRNGKSGPNFPTTWKFLLQKIEEVCGAGVAKDIEKALLSEPTWCDGV